MSPITARRHHGVCKGPLWKHFTAGVQPSSSPSASGQQEEGKSYDYCVLVGHTMTSYVDANSYQKGDHPVSQVRIVGASAWNRTGPMEKELMIETSFRMVTFQGTHVYCTAPSSIDRNTWLAALHAGLEASFSRPSQDQEKPLLTPPSPTKTMKVKRWGQAKEVYCQSCGRKDDAESSKPPVQQASAPLPQYGMETRCDLCPECLVTQGVLLHTQMLNNLYASESHERSALKEARDIALKTVQEAALDENSGVSGSTEEHTGSAGDQSSWTQVGSDASTTEGGTANTAGSWTSVEGNTKGSEPNQPWINIPPSAASTRALLDLVKTASFTSYRRSCPLLDIICIRLETGDMGFAGEFLEALDDESTHGMFQAVDDEAGALKKEALVVAGDMGNAMKLLQDHAVPPTTEIVGDNHTEMLAYLLEFFLDLVDEGELSSVAFFWPQLQCIHLRMLPPGNSHELARVELMEDFLMTVCCKHSVQLAIELIWGYVADLEESLTNATCGAACRKRRFAVMRFLCELESLLFDFEEGWGGGSVSLRGMLVPSKQQVALLREAIETLQKQRKSRFASPCLSRSVRMDKLMEKSAKFTKPPGEAAKEALRIARNADYFSSHLSFTRRLGDIAERLRFMEEEKRANALDRELDLLNTSGSMGGDPLNKALDNNGLKRVVRVPRGEGHVFRSKERTPVLLLMEVTQDGGDEENTISSSAGDDRDIEEVTISPSPQADEGGEQTTAHDEKEMKMVKDEDEEEVGRIEKEDETNTATSDFECREQAKQDDVDQDHSSREKETKELDELDKTEDINEDENSSDDGNNEGKPVETDKAAQTDSNEDVERNEEPIGTIEPDHSSDDKIDTGDANESTQAKDNTGELEKEKEEIIETVGTRSPRSETVDLDEGNTSSPVLTGNAVKAPTTPSRTSTPPLEVNADFERKSSPRHTLGKLKRFEKSDGLSSDCQPPVTPGKEQVKDMVTTMAMNKLNMPDLREPTLISEHQDESIDQVSSKVSEASESTSAVISEASEPSSPGKIDHKEKKRSTSNRKMSRISSTTSVGVDGNDRSSSVNDDIRRDVLATIMVKGMRGANVIASGAAPAAQKNLQALDRKRAVACILDGDESKTGDVDGMNGKPAHSPADLSKGKLGLSLGIEDPVMESTIEAAILESTKEREATSPPSEEDEAIESIRLLLMQAHVAEEDSNPENTTNKVQPNRMASLYQINARHGHAMDMDAPQIDAGDVDSRLVGCGVLPPAVLQALTLWKGGVVSEAELLELVKKDLQYIRHSDENTTKLKEDSAFWGRFAFGERWAEKKARIGATSPKGSLQNWDLLGVIVKSNDDLRQEAFVMQLIELCQEAFDLAGLELWVHPYRILATGRTTGIIEMVRNAMSFDALKKRPGYGKTGLLGHLERMAEVSADPETALRSAKLNFVQSLAAYSLMSYFFLFKDRHNGNLLLDTAGHVIHIDFGFVMGVAPGGSFSLESGIPFKLTVEMLDVMGGLNSTLFSEFVTLFCCGFLALQAHADTFITIVEISCKDSSFKCFEGRESTVIVSELRDRFKTDLSKEDTVMYALDLIYQSLNSRGTSQYDAFQYMSNGVAA